MFNSAGYVQQRWICSTALDMFNSAGYVQQRWICSTALDMFNSAGYVQQRWICSTALDMFNSAGYVQQRWICSTALDMFNSAGYVQQRWICSTALDMFNSAGYVQQRWICSTAPDSDWVCRGCPSHVEDNVPVMFVTRWASSHAVNINLRFLIGVHLVAQPNAVFRKDVLKIKCFSNCFAYLPSLDTIDSFQRSGDKFYLGRGK